MSLQYIDPDPEMTCKEVLFRDIYCTILGNRKNGIIYCNQYSFQILFSNQKNLVPAIDSNRVRLPSAVNATDCDCSYHSKKNRSSKENKDGNDSDDDEDDSDVDDA